MQVPIKRLHIRYHTCIPHELFVTPAMSHTTGLAQRSRPLERLVAVDLPSDEVLTLLLLHQTKLLHSDGLHLDEAASLNGLEVANLVH